MMAAYMNRIESKYFDCSVVQYHNSVHATDVLQAAVCMLKIDDIHQSLLDPNLSTFAVLFSAAIHDVAHPGRNQAFHVKTQSRLAILYSDRSVLEHHHLAVAFSTLRDPQVDFLKALDETDAKLFREKVIQMVLSTDMAMHIENINNLKELVDSSRPLSRAENRAARAITEDTSVTDEMNTLYESDNAVLLCSIVHLCDISNVAKDWSIYKQWIPLIFAEFFDQGDNERDLGFDVGVPYDRANCHPCEMQSYFIDFFVSEYLCTINVWCPRIGELLLANLQANKGHLEANSSKKIDDLWPESDPIGAHSGRGLGEVGDGSPQSGHSLH